ncbi:nuclear transport factor 2 family protein [Sphingomonas sp. 1P06PA]|uniref:nuclear transport factor 2 family protein n=1 Tax=Sphingomonas sp. 1P06PA TaxID=554121 RepID=UPI0039A4BF69
MPFTGPIEDRLAIRELIESYADAVVRVDPEAWGATWAEDAVWSMPDYPQFPTTTGRDNIVALWVEAMKHFPGVIFVANPGSIEIDGDTAKMRSYTSEVYDQEGVTKRDRGVYEDVCVKRDGKWQFKSRTFRNLHRQL